jgi:hypothetical protein
MLRWLRPKTILIINSYAVPGLVLAAKDLKITVSELQHGVITQYHLGYAVSSGQQKETFPDRLFLFGEYWKKTVDYPVTKDRLIVFGYPYWEIEREKYRGIKRLSRVVVLSQGTVGYRLSKFAVDLAKYLLPEIRVIYKLHPGEYQRWKIAYPHLAVAAVNGIITVVEDNKTPLYKLLATSKWILGVNSTAIFEGIGFGCTAVLLDLPGVEYMQPLIKYGICRVISKASEFPLERNTKVMAADTLFQPNWINNLSALKNCSYYRETKGR